MKVQRSDPGYARDAAAEEAFWENPPMSSTLLEANHVGAFDAFINESYTGDPALPWMEDLLARGPFETAAELGGTMGQRERAWLERGSARLDVYDISAKVLSRTRAQLGIPLLESRGEGAPVRFFRADLNFVELPRAAYDVIWTSACVHHLTNLEYLFDQVEQALRPGGLFAIHDYTGESRHLYDAERVRRADEVFQRIPREYRYAEHIALAAPGELSPFEGIRAGETLGLLRQRFETVHLMQSDALYPLGLLVDFAKLERERPELVAMVLDAEREARRDPRLQRCSMYGVFRRHA